tara:strand:- start:25 stop:1110 length:1086 start_codon:yes stop_codon:yes gene_type:complete
MAVPASGNSLSLLGIKREVEVNNYNDTDNTYTNIGLGELALNTEINTFGLNANEEPNDTAPHAMSEWYAYDHDATAPFANTKAVYKDLSTGTANAISFTDTDDTFNFTGTTAWTISFWIKAGWSSSLNDNIHFIIGQKTNATKQIEDMIKIIYNESTNRIECRYGNVAGSGQWYNQAGWLFHSNSGAYAAGYQAAGLGTTYWSSSNRGYVNSDNYTMITITKSTTNTAASMTLYWNANDAGAAPVQTNNNSGSRSSYPLSTTNDRLWSIGSNGVHSGQSGSGQQRKTGNNTATAYNDFTIWNKELSDSEVTELYNSGSVMNATTHSASQNLVGYWKWEGNGNATRSNDNFTISGNSEIANL